MASLRAVGPFNGVLPAATGQVIGFMRDPNKAPYLEYVQEVPAPVEGNGLFRFAYTDPDLPVQMVNVDQYAWGFNDPMPSGEEFLVRFKWASDQTERFACAWTLGDRTQQGWSAAGINLRNYYDKSRLSHAMLIRKMRIVSKITGYSWPAYNTGALNTLRGTTANLAYFDESSGEEMNPGTGTRNPAFQIIKNTQNKVMLRLDRTTNGAIGGEEFIMVFNPVMAQAIAESGEMVNYLKGSPFARDLMVRNKKWGLPDEYNGWKLVVEDTIRASIKYNADGTVADVSAGEKDYLWPDDKILFCSRQGGLDGGYGEQSFSTLSLYTFNGPASNAGAGEAARAGVYVKAEGDSWNEITKGAVVIEDKPVVTADVSGFWLTNCLSPDFLAAA